VLVVIVTFNVRHSATSICGGWGTGLVCIQYPTAKPSQRLPPEITPHIDIAFSECQTKMKRADRF